MTGRMSCVAVVWAVFAGSALGASLSIAPNSNISAGRTAFLAGGPTATQFNWASAFATGTMWSSGALTPQIASTPTLSLTLPDLTVNTVAGALPSSLNLANWIDGDGFDGPGGAAIPDLAINDVESFDLIFGAGHRSVGLAIATGRGNRPDQVDFSGATFQFTARDSGGAVIDSATFSLAAGSGGDAAWLTITSDVAFSKLEIREIGAASIADQYFSNILTSTQDVSTIPLPTGAGMAMVGFGLAGVRRRRVSVH